VSDLDSTQRRAGSNKTEMGRELQANVNALVLNLHKVDEDDLPDMEKAIELVRGVNERKGAMILVAECGKKLDDNPVAMPVKESLPPSKPDKKKSKLPKFLQKLFTK